ncbi:MAG: XRE family transcriptional regulator [Alphaproteobacteria bacterium]|jgi:transcriptional regulator with XRE-family HTH domain|nr:XRE family transcriptional regulator [Alphaproteobacteria bacterium]
MYGNPQRRSASDVQDLRRDGGKWLRELREAAGLSQRELAMRVNQDYYTFISQLETGRGRVPPDRYRDWANALGVPVQSFVKELMRFYDPITFDILFGEDEKDEATSSVERSA